MPSKAEQLPPDLIPVLDLIAEMLADALLKDLEKENANRDDASLQLGKDNQKQERERISGS